MLGDVERKVGVAANHGSASNVDAKLSDKLGDGKIQDLHYSNTIAISSVYV